VYRGRSGHGSAYPAGTSQPAGDVGAGGAVVEVSGGPVGGVSGGAVVAVGAGAVVVGAGTAARPRSLQPAARRTRRAVTATRRTATSVGSEAVRAVSVGGVSRTSTAVWRIRPEVVLTLAERLGEPVDRYVNGSQTWFTETPGGVALEWRLHPVAGYFTPKGLTHNDVWDAVVESLIGGDARLRPESVWDGLECFAAYGDDIEPATLAAAASADLGMAPDAVGLVDHGPIGDRWERTGGAVSIIDLLLAQLGAA